MALPCPRRKHARLVVLVCLVLAACGERAADSVPGHCLALCKTYPDYHAPGMFIGTPLCDESAGQCVQCVTDEHCTIFGMLGCNATTRRCVRCRKDADCSSPRTCNTATGECRECASDLDCAGHMQPICNVSTGRCGCTSDAQCQTLDSSWRCVGGG